MPPTQSAFGTEVVARRSLLGTATTSPRVASLTVALLAAVSVASVAMLVFNPFSGSADVGVASSQPAASMQGSALASGTQPEAATLADDIVTPAEAAEPAPMQAEQADAAEPPQSVADATADIDEAGTDLSADVEPLTSDDPRWASASSRVNPLTIRKDAPEASDTNQAAFAGDRYASVATTLPEASSGDKAQREEEQGDIGGETVKKASTAGMGTARIRSSVNMRSRGASGASVLGVVPSGAEVAIAEGCRHWCKIVYNGRTGYVYKSFVRQ